MRNHGLRYLAKGTNSVRQPQGALVRSRKGARLVADSTAGQVLPGVRSWSEPELCRAVLHRLPGEAAFVFGADLGCVFAVGGALSRWSPQGILGPTPADLLPTDEAVVLEEHYGAALKGETRHPEHPGLRPPGTVWSSGLSDDELLSLVVRAAGAAENAQEVVASLSGELEVRLPFSSRQDDVALLVLRVRSALGVAAPATR
jgi:hypothetical protein